MDVDRSRVAVYILVAVVLGPLLISALPLVAPEEPMEAASPLGGQEKRPSIMMEDRGEVEPEMGEQGEFYTAPTTEGGRVMPPLPILWLLDLSIALSIYLLVRRIL